MTSNGASDPLDAFGLIPASCACRLQRNVYIHMEPDEGEMKEWIVGKGKRSILPTWVEYKYLNFHKGVKNCSIIAKGNCKVTLRTSDSFICGNCMIDSSEFQSYTFSVEGLEGIKPIWFDFFGDDFEFVSFCFS